MVTSTKFNSNILSLLILNRFNITFSNKTVCTS